MGEGQLGVCWVAASVPRMVQGVYFLLRKKYNLSLTLYARVANAIKSFEKKKKEKIFTLRFIVPMDFLLRWNFHFLERKLSGYASLLQYRIVAHHGNVIWPASFYTHKKASSLAQVIGIFQNY